MTVFSETRTQDAVVDAALYRFNEVADDVPPLCSYVIFTAVVVLSERVEATVQKGFFRFVGTVIGGRPLLSCAPQHHLCHGSVWPPAAGIVEDNTPKQCLGQMIIS